MAALSGVFDPRRDRRDSNRQGAALTATVLLDGWECSTISLIEVSAGGFRAVHSDCFLSGETIRVSIPGLGPIDARIKWCDGRTFGAEFVDRSDLRLLFLGGPVSPRTTWLERLAA